MKTKELIAQLQQLDPSGDLEVIQTRCSDYNDLEPSDVFLVSAVRKKSARYIMRAHPTMSAKDKSNEQTFVHFDGN